MFAVEGKGRFFLLFMRNTGYQQGHTILLSQNDVDIGPQLKPRDMFAAALAGYQDVDKNGIREILVGAPGDSGFSGAVYMIFLRRHKFHKPIPCTACYYSMILGPSVGCCLCCVIATIIFFWYFQRQPDEIEILAKKHGVEITANRKRKRLVVVRDATVYADEYMA